MNTPPRSSRSFFGMAFLSLTVLPLLAGCGGGGSGGAAVSTCTGEPDPTSNNLTQDPPTTWTVNPNDATQAFMNGTIDGSTRANLTTFLDTNPGVKELVLQDCPGSEDDHANILACRVVRARGLNTRLQSTSVIASGAVDFFIAGVRRFDAAGSQILVHSWADGNGTLGRDLPRDHCDHQLYIKYYIAMGLPDPAGFYFTTLQSGLPTVNLTQQQRQTFRVVTN